MSTPDILRQKGIKATWQRIAVYEMLKAKGHSTAEDIHASLIANLPTLSLATVYSILNLFYRKELIGEVGVYNNRSYFDITIGFHHHFICLRCGEIRNLDIPFCRALQEKKVEGNIVERFTGIFYGLCSRCSEEEGRKR